jgi:hypothetical protein
LKTIHDPAQYPKEIYINLIASLEPEKMHFGDGKNTRLMPGKMPHMTPSNSWIPNEMPRQSIVKEGPVSSANLLRKILHKRFSGQELG